MRGLLVIFVGMMFLHACNDTKEVESKVESAVADSLVMDLVADEGVEAVIRNCTACHSSKLIAQNRASRDGWKSMIRWMQSTQNLWDLGADEDMVLDYLAKNYAPEKTGRRKNLENIEWYKLEEE